LADSFHETGIEKMTHEKRVAKRGRRPMGEQEHFKKWDNIERNQKTHFLPTSYRMSGTQGNFQRMRKGGRIHQRKEFIEGAKE